MGSTVFMDNAKVMSKGQVTIPKSVRDVLGIDCGDKVTFIVEGQNVRVVNAAVYAMQMLGYNMQGEAEKVGIVSPDDVDELVRAIRSSDESAD